MGMVSIPVFLPLVAIEFELSGAITGLILCTPALTSILTVPFVTAYAVRVGIELTVFTSAVIFGVAFIVLGFASSVSSSTSFVWIAMVSSIMIGISSASNIVGE